MEPNITPNSLNRILHIVSLNVPYPPNYGGVYDLYFKLPALKQEGVQIHLHCFDYGRGPQKELEQHCVSVHYYSRNVGHKGLSTKLPYIVASRQNEQLAQTLLQDNYPIFMEGVHCTFPLMDPRFKERPCFVRLHNVEYQYYSQLAEVTKSFSKKLYYKWESNRLKAYEREIASKATFWGVTEKDDDVYRNEFGCKNIEHLPLYIPDTWSVSGQEGLGSYCLYHGDLSVPSNEQAAFWLLENVFQKLKVPFVIAGKNPSERLKKKTYEQTHTCIVENPSDAEMEDMIKKAHIHVLPSYIKTGIKIKLVHALFHGRHVVVNPATVDGSNLESACYVAKSAQAFADTVAQLYHQPFTNEELELRRKLLGSHFNNQNNAQKMVKWIWG